MSIKTISNRLTSDDQWKNFSQKDHQIWSMLFDRQSTILQTRAAPEVIKGMEKLSIRSAHIPKFSELNKILRKETNFCIIPVEGLVSDDLFFKLLSQRKFPSTCFIRKLHQLDYLEEPDIFHDVFGHVPLLVNPVFADFMQAFGCKGLEAIECGLLKFAATLYWFTVEFGLINTPQGLRIYGAGITSSKGESIYSLESKIPVRVHFNLQRLLKTQYHIDSFQKTYFVIENFKELFDVLKMLDWEALRDTCLSFPEIEQGISLNNQETIF